MRAAKISGITVTLVILGAAPAIATPDLMVKAKGKGYPAQNCQYCHNSAAPKKDTFKPEDLNERGKWMEAERQKKNLKAADVDTLADYPGGKEQK
jgi:hypothetical protein